MRCSSGGVAPYCRAAREWASPQGHAWAVPPHSRRSPSKAVLQSTHKCNVGRTSSSILLTVCCKEKPKQQLRPTCTASMASMPSTSSIASAPVSSSLSTISVNCNKASQSAGGMQEVAGSKRGFAGSKRGFAGSQSAGEASGCRPQARRSSRLQVQALLGSALPAASPPRQQSAPLPPSNCCTLTAVRYLPTWRPRRAASMSAERMRETIARRASRSAANNQFRVSGLPVWDGKEQSHRWFEL